MKNWRQVGNWQIALTWTNWTFGIWWAQIHRDRAFGIDLGPLEMSWSKRIRLPNSKDMQ